MQGNRTAERRPGEMRNDSTSLSVGQRTHGYGAMTPQA